MVYGSPASGAGWIVPKAYYEKVGKDGFKQRTDRRWAVPLRQADGRPGARARGVHRLLAQDPATKTIVFKGIPEISTRVALLKTGDVDAAHQMQGELLPALRKEGQYRIGRGTAARPSGWSWGRWTVRTIR